MSLCAHTAQEKWEIWGQIVCRKVNASKEGCICHNLCKLGVPFSLPSKASEIPLSLSLQKAWTTASTRTDIPLLLAVFLLPLVALCLLSAPKASATPAEAFSIGKPPLKITVLTGPRNDFCYSDNIEAIEKLVKGARDRINKAGGVAGRKIEIDVRDDGGDPKRTVANVSAAVADPQTIALMGLQNSDRAKEVFKELGPRIKESGIPWISGIMTTNLIADYPNVF